MGVKDLQNHNLNATEQVERARNSDPVSGEPGAHPIGTGLGAAMGGAAAGAAAGTIAGPIGAIAGTIIGGIAGALAGKAVAESVDPTVESTYWKTEYSKRPYAKSDLDFAAYEPAYRAGWESYSPASEWPSVEPVAKKRWEENWESEGGAPSMTWEEAKAAAEDAYHRVHAQRKQPKPNE